jgi:hypothetical protein
LARSTPTMGSAAVAFIHLGLSSVER